MCVCVWGGGAKGAERESCIAAPVTHAAYRRAQEASAARGKYDDKVVTARQSQLPRPPGGMRGESRRA